MKRISGGQLSRKAKATHLSSHAEGPRTAAGDTSLTGQAKAVDTAVESQPAASPRTYRSGRTSPPRQPVTLTVTAVSTAPSICAALEETERSDPAERDACFHEDGEVSRRLPTGDRAPPSRRIQQRRQAAAFVQRRAFLPPGAPREKTRMGAHARIRREAKLRRNRVPTLKAGSPRRSRCGLWRRC